MLSGNPGRLKVLSALRELNSRIQHLPAIQQHSRMPLLRRIQQHSRMPLLRRI